MSHKILVLEGLTKRGQELLQAEGWVVDHQKALPPAELAAIIPPYDAMLIRSGSKITPEVLAAAKNLKVIGRGGVGVDNVDLAAATRHGVMVMNSPGGNMISTAELAMALILAVARHIAPADASMKAQRWDRKSFAGTELHGKRIGIVGLGRIGREVAARCRAFGMEVMAYDPFVSPALAEAAQVRLVTLDELLAAADFITLHTALTPESKGLIGREALSKVKPGVRIINAARGELIDDAALLEALESGRVAAAGLDVHVQEPPKDWALATHPKVVALPHLGASTAEAQEKVGTDIARQVRDFLKGGIIQQAVNFYSLAVDEFEQVKPAMDLAERLGSFLAQTTKGTPKRFEVGVCGDLTGFDTKIIVSAAANGLLQGLLGGGVTMVNAMALAKEKGIEVETSTSSAPISFSNLIALRYVTSEEDVSVAGTVFGPGHLRLVDIDGVDVDSMPQGNIILVKNDDTPGIVGRVGSALGERKVNIARMGLGRKPGMHEAVMLIEVDSEVPPAIVSDLSKLPGVRLARFARLS